MKFNGFFFVDKPKGLTSFEVVKEVRRKLALKAGVKPSAIKIGHSGTLDRLASGLLILGVGEGCKLLEFLLGCDKEYEVLACFGAVSDTYDADGKVEVLERFENAMTKTFFDDLNEVIRENFLGKILQIPPKFSAVKISGKRASDRVRAGEELELKPRSVEIYNFEILENKFPFVSFLVRCSSGTYVRSLIHDLGWKMGCGAYVHDLRRKMIDGFDIDAAFSLDNIDEQKIVSLESVARCFFILSLNKDEFEKLGDGRILKNKKIEQGDFAMAFYDGHLVGVLENFDSGVKYRKVIN